MFHSLCDSSLTCLGKKNRRKSERVIIFKETLSELRCGIKAFQATSNMGFLFF